MKRASYAPLGRMSMPPDFRYRDVFLKGPPRHEPGGDFDLRHPPMAPAHWAKIFAPFDALRGFSAAVIAKEAVYVARPELDEDAAQELDRRLALLSGLASGRRRAAELPEVTLTRWVPCADEHSFACGTAGSLETLRGRVLCVDAEVTRTLTLLTDAGEERTAIAGVVSVDSGDRLFDAPE